MEERAIYEVYAKIVDANGSYNTLSGYPKVFDSRSYNNDVGKAFNRARAEYHSTLGAMYTRDDRMLQMVMLMHADGTIYMSEAIGTLDSNNTEPEE